MNGSHTFLLKDLISPVKNTCGHYGNFHISYFTMVPEKQGSDKTRTGRGTRQVENSPLADSVPFPTISQ